MQGLKNFFSQIRRKNRELTRKQGPKWQLCSKPGGHFEDTWEEYRWDPRGFTDVIKPDNVEGKKNPEPPQWNSHHLWAQLTKTHSSAYWAPHNGGCTNERWRPRRPPFYRELMRIPAATVSETGTRSLKTSYYHTGSTGMKSLSASPVRPLKAAGPVGEFRWPGENETRHSRYN